MKKTVIIVVIAAALCAVLAIGAVALVTGKLVPMRETKEKQEFSGAAVKDAEEIVNTIVSEAPGDDSEAQSDIPVYRESDLLSLHSCFELLFDQRQERNLNTATTAAEILALYPDPAVRHLEDGRMYFAYDTDTGYRLFVLLDTEWPDRVLPAGFYVIVKDAHCIADFAELKKGDTMSAVEAIDSVTGIYRKYIDEMRTPPDRASSEKKNDRGYPYTTVHYLNDGLLLIEYLVNDDAEFVINKIRYFEDYRVTNPEGEIVNYKLDDIDLPYNEN